MPRQGRGPLVLAAVGGAVAAGLVAAVLIATGVVGGGSDDLGADTSEISLPDEVGGLRTMDDVTAELSDGDPEVVEGADERTSRVVDLTADAYTEAYDGAATEAQIYSDDEAMMRVVVVAIRASSPRPAPGIVSDPETTGFDRSFVEVVEHDDVVCLDEMTSAATVGDEVDPDDLITVECSKSADGITVIVHGIATTGDAGADLMVESTRDAWDAVA